MEIVREVWGILYLNAEMVGERRRESGRNVIRNGPIVRCALRMEERTMIARLKAVNLVVIFSFLRRGVENEL